MAGTTRIGLELSLPTERRGSLERRRRVLSQGRGGGAQSERRVELGPPRPVRSERCRVGLAPTSGSRSSRRRQPRVDASENSEAPQTAKRSNQKKKLPRIRGCLTAWRSAASASPNSSGCYHPSRRAAREGTI